MYSKYDLINMYGDWDYERCQEYASYVNMDGNNLKDMNYLMPIFYEFEVEWLKVDDDIPMNFNDEKKDFIEYVFKHKLEERRLKILKIKNNI